MMQPDEVIPLVDDPEAITRAKHKGRAYQCMPCFHKEGKETIDVRGRVEEHILKNHVSLDEVPFYCRLCLFRCQRREQLIQHVTSYARHREMANKRGVTDNSQFLVTSPNPHQFTEADYIKLSAEASLRHFLRHQTAQSTSPVAAAVRRMELGQLMDDVSKSTLDAGYINCTDSPVALQHPTPTQTAGEITTRPIQLNELQPSLVQSLLNLLSGASSPSTAPVTLTAQTNVVPNTVTGSMETVGSSSQEIPQYVPTPKTLLRRMEKNRSNWAEVSNPEIAMAVSDGSWQPVDLNTGTAAPEQDQPLDLRVKPAIHENPGSMSRQDKGNSIMTASSAEQQIGKAPEVTTEQVNTERRIQEPAMDTRCVVVVGEPVPAHSPSKVSEAAESIQGDPVTPGRHQETQDSEEEEPLPSYAPEAQTETDEPSGGNQQEENILTQILAPEPMELSSDKRPFPDEDAPRAKRRKEVEGPTVNISLVAVNSLVSVLQDLKENERQRIKAEEMIAKTLTETASAMQRLTGAVFRLEEMMKTTEREERKREERRQEFERAKQLERKREKEEERRWEEKRWEMDRIARGDRRRAEEKQKEKERKPSLPSVLGNNDKENNARKSKRKE
ncbi:MAG: hypothetical protein AB2661_21050 [Candidatus Thiodiazotropha sp.]